MIFSIIIVNYNGMRWINENIESFSRQTMRNDDYEIILVDNASTDGSVELVEEKYPHVRVIRTENNGFGSACNVGAGRARGKYLMFFNEDIFVEECFLDKYHARLKEGNFDDDTFGTAGCSIWGYDKRPTSQSNEYGAGIDLLAIPSINLSSKRHFYNAGCPLLVKKNSFLKVGGFCENIFLYSEDLDLCWRMKIYGYEHYFFSDIKIFHYGGGVVGPFSSQKLSFYITGELNCVWNNYSIYLLPIILFLQTSFYLAIILIYIITLKWKLAATILRAFYGFYSNNFINVLKYRHIVQGAREVSDWAVLKKVYLIPSRLRNFLYLNLFIRINTNGRKIL